MTEAHYTGEEVLAMLEQHHVDPDELPDILRREQTRRRDDLITDLYERIVRGDESSYGVIQKINDVGILQELLFMSASSEKVMRDELEGWREKYAVDDITDLI